MYPGTKLWENDSDCFPHQLIINGKICVREFVPHPGNLAPGNFRRFICHRLRQQLDRFTNNQEIIDYGIRCFFISNECLKAYTACIRIDPVKSGKDILTEQAFISYEYEVLHYRIPHIAAQPAF